MCLIEGCAKFVVFAFNLVFVLVGAGLITLGIFYTVHFNQVTDAIPTEYDSLRMIPILTIVVGSVIFLISFFGCCGACKKSSCLLTTYAVILLVIFVLQIALGVFVFLEVNDTKDLKENVKKGIEKVFIDAKNNNKTEGVAGLIQQQLKCCGVDGASFWDGKIPKTCYPGKDSSKTSYSAGCANKFFDFIQSSSKIIGITVLVLSATEVIGAVVSLCLANSIRNEKRRLGY